MWKNLPLVSNGKNAVSAVFKIIFAMPFLRFTSILDFYARRKLQLMDVTNNSTKDYILKYNRKE